MSCESILLLTDSLATFTYVLAGWLGFLPLRFFTVSIFVLFVDSSSGSTFPAHPHGAIVQIFQILHNQQHTSLYALGNSVISCTVFSSFGFLTHRHLISHCTVWSIQPRQTEVLKIWNWIIPGILTFFYFSKFWRQYFLNW